MTPRPPKDKETPPQATLGTSNLKEFLAPAGSYKKNQRKKRFRHIAIPFQNDDNLFDEKDMSLLLTAVVGTVASARGGPAGRQRRQSGPP